MSGKKVRDAAIVLLTLNEIEGLERLWDDIPIGSFREVVAVDGGSTDGTREFLQENNCCLEIHSH